MVDQKYQSLVPKFITRDELRALSSCPHNFASLDICQAFALPATKVSTA